MLMCNIQKIRHVVLSAAELGNMIHLGVARNRLLGIVLKDSAATLCWAVKV